jgi:uncharacterized protein (TIGR02300 family)
MGRPEFGAKCVCVNCEERFYDLNRMPATCPKCAMAQPPPVPRSVRPSRPATALWRAADRRAQAAEEELAEPTAAADDGDEELLLDPNDEAEADDEEVDAKSG